MLPAVLIIGGLLAFEAHTWRKAAYRMEPLYMYDQFVTAGVAARRCGDYPAELREQFARNLRAREDRTLAALAEERPHTSADEIAAEIAARRAEGEREVAAEIERNGCDSSEIRTLLKRYEIRASRRLG
jgi:hypothetical protein